MVIECYLCGCRSVHVKPYRRCRILSVSATVSIPYRSLSGINVAFYEIYMADMAKQLHKLCACMRVGGRACVRACMRVTMAYKTIVKSEFFLTCFVFDLDRVEALLQKLTKWHFQVVGGNNMKS